MAKRTSDGWPKEEPEEPEESEAFRGHCFGTATYYRVNGKKVGSFEERDVAAATASDIMQTLPGKIKKIIDDHQEDQIAGRAAAAGILNAALDRAGKAGNNFHITSPALVFAAFLLGDGKLHDKVMRRAFLEHGKDVVLKNISAVSVAEADNIDTDMQGTFSEGALYYLPALLKMYLNKYTTTTATTSGDETTRCAESPRESA